MGKNNKFQKKNRGRLFRRFLAFLFGAAVLGTGSAYLASKNARTSIENAAKKVVKPETYAQAFEDVANGIQSIVGTLKGKGIEANIPAGATGEIVEDSEAGMEEENNQEIVEDSEATNVQSNSGTTTGVTQSNTSTSTAGVVENNQNVGNKVDSTAKNIAESAHENSQKLGETNLTNKTIDEYKSEIYTRVKSLLQENENLSSLGSQFETDDQIIAILEKTIAEKNKQTIESEALSLYDFIDFSDIVAKDEEFNESIRIAIDNYSLLERVNEKAEKDAQGDATPTEEISKDIEEKTPDQGTYVQAYDTQRSQVKLGLAGALAGVGIASFAVFEYLKRRLAKGSSARKSETRFYMGQRNVRSAEKLSRIEQEIDNRNKKVRSLAEKNVRSNNKINNSVRNLKIQTQLKKIAKLEKKESKLEEKCYRASKYSADKNEETNYKYLKRYSSRAYNLQQNSFVNRVRGKKRRAFFNNELRLGLETYANVIRAVNYFARYKISNKSKDLKKLIKHLNNLSEQQRKLIFEPHVYFAESIDMKGFQQKKEYEKLIIKETDKKLRGTNSNDNYAVPRLPISMDRYFQTPDTLPEKEYHVFKNMFNMLHKQFPNAEKGTIYTTVSYQYTDNAGEIKTSTYHFAFNNKKASKMFKDMIISKVGSLTNLKHVEVSETTVTPYTIKENTKIFASENKDKSGPNYGGTIEQFKFEYALNKQTKLLEELRKLNQTFTKVDMADDLVARQLSGRDPLLDGKNKMDWIAEKKVPRLKRILIERKARKQIEKEYKERNEQQLNQSIASQNSELNNQSDVSDPKLAAYIEKLKDNLGIRKKDKLKPLDEEAKKAKKKAEKEQKKAAKEQKKLERKNKNVQKPKTVEQPVQDQTINSATKPLVEPAPVQKTKQPEAVATPAPQNKVVERKAEELETPKQPVPAEHKVTKKKPINAETTEFNFNFPPYNPPPTGECRIRDPYNDAFVEGFLDNSEDGTPVDTSARVVNNLETTRVDAVVVDEEKEKLEYELEQYKKIEEKLTLREKIEDSKNRIRKLQKSADAQEPKSPEKKATTKKELTQEKVKTTIGSSAVGPQKKVTKTTSKIASKQPKNEELSD